ncbi:siderophore-interacting protein [Gordonia phthalatica]|uniref:siderophore-interacting protein n=1 Tax=Gordonia phthalatica TaxID=1136941 RepID=UPI001D04754B|nr:siderophore-interacting protein [Gordonia phthalatica]
MTAVSDLTPRMRRLTLAAPDLGTLVPTGPDEYVGLLMGRHPGHRIALPEHGVHPNIRAAVAAVDAEHRPVLRWYTVRAHRPEVGEIDVDIVLHGDSGPGSRFATSAAVGTRLGITEGSALFDSRPRGVVWVVGDETAIPAIARIVECSDAATTVHAVVETESAADVLPLDSCASQTWVTRGADRPGTAMLDAVRAAAVPLDIDAVWVCGEQAAVAAVRRHLVGERGVPPARITFSGYWRLGRSRG